MDATIMPSTNSLLDTVQVAFEGLKFHAGDRFEWRPGEQTIVYDLDDPDFDAHLLHELGHATLGHDSYERDIDLIAMERDAWQAALMEHAPRFNTEVDGDVIHHGMETYRDWLHARSTCPHCGSTGIQIKKAEYKCVTCLKTWRVNEARSCQLRRYRLT